MSKEKERTFGKYLNKELNPKEQALIKKGEAERAQMEKKAKAPITILYLGTTLKTLFRLKDTDLIDGFQVSLRKKMPIKEINERMMKAFGDL